MGSPCLSEDFSFFFFFGYSLQNNFNFQFLVAVENLPRISLENSSYVQARTRVLHSYHALRKAL
jgi:hypothetical protein